MESKIAEISTDIKWIKRELEDQKNEIKMIKKALSDLNAFKNKVYGIAIGVSVTVSLITSIVMGVMLK